MAASLVSYRLTVVLAVALRSSIRSSSDLDASAMRYLLVYGVVKLLQFQYVFIDRPHMLQLPPNMSDCGVEIVKV